MGLAVLLGSRNFPYREKKILISVFKNGKGVMPCVLTNTTTAMTVYSFCHRSRLAPSSEEIVTQLPFKPISNTGSFQFPNIESSELLAFTLSLRGK